MNEQQVEAFHSQLKCWRLMLIRPNRYERIMMMMMMLCMIGIIHMTINCLDYKCFVCVFLFVFCCWPDFVSTNYLCATFWDRAIDDCISNWFGSLHTDQTKALTIMYTIVFLLFVGNFHIFFFPANQASETGRVRTFSSRFSLFTKLQYTILMRRNGIMKVNRYYWCGCCNFTMFCTRETNKKMIYEKSSFESFTSHEI